LSTKPARAERLPTILREAPRQVEAARYDLLWAGTGRTSAWKARVEGGATAAAPGGDNVAMYRDGAEGRR
jgi:hypothetical protein